MRAQSCPGPDELRSFVRCEMPESASEAINCHLQECSDCEATVERLERDGDTVAERIRRSVSQPTFATEPECQALLQTLADEATLAPTQVSRAVSDSAAGGAAGSSAAPGSGGISDPAAPERLRDYRLLDKLGEGGMGAVYKAQHQRLKRVVAVKILPANRLAEPQSLARFEREMEVLGQLDHPNIVRALDAGEHDGRHYLVMEYVEGLDLAAIVKARGPLRIADACQAISEAALGLQYAHEHGYVHRDIKPSNLMVARQGAASGRAAHVKILDLGLARALDSAPATQGGGPELTATSQVMGTLDYMAPEQGGDAHQVDIRADIYSLGATFYKLLTGVSPFADQSHKAPLQRLMAMAASDPPPVQSKRPEIPAPLAAVVTRMLAKRADDRFAVPADIVAALEPFCAGANLAALVGDSGKARATAAASPTQAATQVATQTATRSGSGRRQRTAVGWGAAALIALAVILTITTRHGTIVVDAPDGQLPPDIQVSVTQGGQEVTVLQAKNQWSAKVVNGEYQLQVRNGDDRFELADSQLTVTRMGKVVVKLQLTPPPAGGATPPPPNSVAKNSTPTLPANKPASSSPPPAARPRPDQPQDRPFVLVREGKDWRPYRSLVGALADQRPGDVIEVRAHGVVAVQLPAKLPATLSLRGALGYRPLLAVRPTLPPESLPEGMQWNIERCDLDLRNFGSIYAAPSMEQPSQCRLQGCRVWGGAFMGWNKFLATDCVLLAPNGFVSTLHTPASEVHFENCAIQNNLALIHVETGRHTITLSRCTYYDVDGHTPNLITVSEGAEATINATHCVFHRNSQSAHLIEPKSMPRVVWNGANNCFSGNFWVHGELQADGTWKLLDKGLSAWQKHLKGTERDSIEVPELAFERGRIQRLGEGRLAEVAAAVQTLTADAEPGSVGPDWPLVGAGEAYVRALAAAGRSIPEADLRPEQLAEGPFTLLIEGAQPRGFKTLSAAFESAPDRAVVEVRSDGPFPAESIPGRSRRLVVRAAPGFRPIFNGLIFTDGALVELEGLVLQDKLQIVAPPPADGKATSAKSPSSRLVRAQNCETFHPNFGVLHVHFASQPAAEIVNCSFGHAEFLLDPEAQVTWRNSVAMSLNATTVSEKPNPGTVRIEHCALFYPEHPITWSLTNVSARTPTRFASQSSIYVAPLNLFGLGSPAQEWSGDHNWFSVVGSLTQGGAPSDLSALQAATSSDAHSREIAPWQFHPRQWRILPDKSPGYQALPDGDYGADIARLTAATLGPENPQ